MVWKDRFVSKLVAKTNSIPYILTTLLSITITVFWNTLPIHTLELITFTFPFLLTHLPALITAIGTVSVTVTSPAAVNTEVMLKTSKLISFAHFCSVINSISMAVYFILSVNTV